MISRKRARRKSSTSTSLFDFNFTMPSVQEKILSAIPENTRLLKSLEETDYAVSAIQQSSAYIEELSKELSREQENLRKCSKTVASEYADHKKYRDSHMKRLAYKLGGKKEKFAEEASKEEKEWLEAVRKELIGRKNVERLESKVAEAKATNAELSEIVKTHWQMKSQLDALYRSIFDGPTSGMSGEDEKEQQTNQAEKTFNDAQLRLSNEVQARKVLLDADKYLSLALRDLESAMSAATADVWGVGGSFADMQKHSTMSLAQANVSHVEFLMDQARRIQPAIQSIGNLDVAEMHFMTDVFFDNIFSDLNARDRINDSLIMLTKAKDRLVQQLHAADQRIKIIEWERDQCHATFNSKREELQRVRAKAIDTIANSATNSDLPPGYTE
jgi:uncharacterized coiled-coil protein SlyX